MAKRPGRVLVLAVLSLSLQAVGWSARAGRDSSGRPGQGSAAAGLLAERWAAFSGNRQGKVVFARPPRMLLLDLSTGIEKEIPGAVTAGAVGRKGRGASPRPSWDPDGERFAYRFANRIYVCDERGRKRPVLNRRMDCSDETRWTWFRENGSDWLAGPSLDGNVILVKVSDPNVVKTAYGGGNVKKHCEITGSGRFIVYDDGAAIYVTPFGGRERGIRISRGQSCRPCAAADDRVAWLPSPHDRYRIFRAADGRFLGDLLAPPGEEILRLNWSNLPDFAVHMYGATDILRMHVRKISSGGYLFIGSGWDPDLWVSPRSVP